MKPVKPENLQRLVDAIFASGEVVVYEAYSVPDKALRTFDSSKEVFDYIDEVKVSKSNLAYLSLHYTKANGFIYKKTIALEPKKCNGAKTRYSVEGWGLIQFQLWLNPDGLSCGIGGNSEKRAGEWESTKPMLKSPALWDWKEVQKQHRRLKRVLKLSG